MSHEQYHTCCILHGSNLHHTGLCRDFCSLLKGRLFMHERGLVTAEAGGQAGDTQEVDHLLVERVIK